MHQRPNKQGYGRYVGTNTTVQPTVAMNKTTIPLFFVDSTSQPNTSGADVHMASFSRKRSDPTYGENAEVGRNNQTIKIQSYSSMIEFLLSVLSLLSW